MDRSQLKTLSDSYIADAPPNNITAANVRDLNDEVINSCALIDDNNVFNGGNTFNAVTNFKNQLNTALTSSLTIQTEINIYSANTYIYISGSNDSVLRFIGDYMQNGNFRFLKFYDPCTIVYDPTYIVTPNNQNIEVQSGDTCIVFPYGDVTYFLSYTRFSGEQINTSKIWTWSDQVPTLFDDIANGFQQYYRWISQESSGRLREWYLDNPIVNSAVWNPTSGTFGKWGDNTDLMINNIFYASVFPILITNYRINYYRIGRLFYLIGWIEVEDPQGQSVGWKLDFNNNNQGIDFTPINLKGVGVVTDSQKLLKNDEYRVSFGGINIIYELSYTPSPTANIRVYFNISTPYNAANL